MGVIDPASSNKFISASSVYGKVKRFLSQYNFGNLIDEGEFPIYIKEVIGELGIGAFKELDAVSRVKNHRAPLPNDFILLDAAYKCSHGTSSKELIHPQGGARIFNDVTWELMKCGDGKCEISCYDDGKVFESITVRQYIKESPTTTQFVNPILLRLSPNVKANKCLKNCANLLASSAYEITIDDDVIYTNFDNDFIYMKYYGLAVDENGVPQIPDDDNIKKAIEWYIIYQVTLKWWFNNQVPDLERRWQFAEKQYDLFFSKAKHTSKVPSFSRVVNMIRRKRSTNMVTLMRQTDNYGYWQ